LPIPIVEEEEEEEEEEEAPCIELIDPKKFCLEALRRSSSDEWSFASGNEDDVLLTEEAPPEDRRFCCWEEADAAAPLACCAAETAASLDALSCSFCCVEMVAKISGDTSLPCRTVFTSLPTSEMIVKRTSRIFTTLAC
jgi:hypothetical protein